MHGCKRTGKTESVNKSKDIYDIWEKEIDTKGVQRKKCIAGELAKDEPLILIHEMKV